MKVTKQRMFACAAILALFLTACGGSDNNDLHSKDLYGAYEVVTEGMSLTQLKTVIGAEPAGSRADGDDITIYTWVADEGSYLETKLHVNLQADYGVVGKTDAVVVESVRVKVKVREEDGTQVVTL